MFHRYEGLLMWSVTLENTTIVNTSQSRRSVKQRCLSRFVEETVVKDEDSDFLSDSFFCLLHSCIRPAITVFVGVEHEVWRIWLRFDLTADLRISRISDFILRNISWGTNFDFDKMRQIRHDTIEAL